MTETTTLGAPDALVERLFSAIVGTLEVASVHLGGRLGFYRALAESPAATSAELATRTGTTERYVREWLEQQAVAGFLTVDDPDADPTARRYTLPQAYRPVLVDETDLNYLTPFAGIAIDMLGPWEQLLSAYRNGGGVPFEAYGRDLVDMIGAANRPQFVTSSRTGWPASRTSASDCPPRRQRASRTSRAAPRTRASKSPAPTHKSPSTRSTSTRLRSNGPAPTPPRRASTTACNRSCTTPNRPGRPGRRAFYRARLLAVLQAAALRTSPGPGRSGVQDVT